MVLVEMIRPCSQPERLLESDRAAFHCLPVHRTVVEPVMGTGPGATTEPHSNAGDGRAVPCTPALRAASLLFNACLYVCSSVLCLSNDLFD